MTREEMIVSVTAEIQRLEKVRQLLAKSHSDRFVLQDPASASLGAARRRTMSPEAKQRIGLAQKQRWAAQTSQPAPAAEAK